MPRCLQFFRQQFFVAGFADRGHGFDLEIVGNIQLFRHALVIEAFHPVDYCPWRKPWSAKFSQAAPQS